MCYTFIGIYVNGWKNNREKWNKKQEKKMTLVTRVPAVCSSWAATPSLAVQPSCLQQLCPMVLLKAMCLDL